MANFIRRKDGFLEADWRSLMRELPPSPAPPSGCLCSGYSTLGECKCGNTPWDSNVSSLDFLASNPDRKYLRAILDNKGLPGWEVVLRCKETGQERVFHVLKTSIDDETGFCNMTLVPIEDVILLSDSLHESIEPPKRTYHFDE